jgi:thiamine-monophosphate kinase
MPGRTDLRFAEGLYSGIRSLADRFGVSIVGGDVSRSEKIVIDISMIGEVERARLVTRRGAVRGDLICVTGSIGGSSRLKHLNFTPRVKEARRIVRDYKISSMIDVSDGLMLDLWRIADASGVGARIYQNAVPLSPDAGGFDEAVRSGEDFELLFTMGVGEARRFFTGGLARMKTPVTLIGEVTDKRDGLVIVRKDGRPERVKAAGYTHFR